MKKHLQPFGVEEEVLGKRMMTDTTVLLCVESRSQFLPLLAGETCSQLSPGPSTAGCTQPPGESLPPLHSNSWSRGWKGRHSQWSAARPNLAFNPAPQQDTTTQSFCLYSLPMEAARDGVGEAEAF